MEVFHCLAGSRDTLPAVMMWSIPVAAFLMRVPARRACFYWPEGEWSYVTIDLLPSIVVIWGLFLQAVKMPSIH